MTRLRTILACLLLATLSGCVICLTVRTCALLYAATETARQLPLQIAQIREYTFARVDSALTEVAELRRTADARLASIQADARPVLEETRETVAAARPVLASLQHTSDGVQPVLEAARGQIVRVGPMIDSMNEAAQQTSSTVAVLRPQMLGTVSAAKVTLGHVAQMSIEGQKAFPKVTASVVSIGQSSEAIAADVRREVDAATRPRKWWQRLLGPVYMVGRLAAAFI